MDALRLTYVTSNRPQIFTSQEFPQIPSPPIVTQAPSVCLLSSSSIMVFHSVLLLTLPLFRPVKQLLSHYCLYRR